MLNVVAQNRSRAARSVDSSCNAKTCWLLVDVCVCGSIFDELGRFLRVRHVGHVARVHFDGGRIGALGHHAFLYRIDRPIRAGHHIPGGLGLPGGIRDLVGERISGDRYLRSSHECRARLFDGNTQAEDKLVSLFEPQTEIIRKGKASKPTEFGKLVKIQEAENQIVIAYEVYEQRPNDKDLLVPSVEIHQQRLNRVPTMVAGDAGFYSAQGEAQVQGMGVKRLSVPNRSTKSTERRRYQKQRWFRKGQKWRTGCEGRISILKRRHGLRRCHYKGNAGMKRWVGLGVIGDNLINIGRALPQ